MNRIILKRKREKSLLNRHPWVFSGAIAAVKGNPVAGETVVVTSAGGDFLGWGAYSPASQIRVRLWSFREQEQIDEDFFLRRIRQAHDLRAAVIRPEQTNAYRLVNAESDGLPGLIVDRYDRLLVVQFLSAGSEFHRETIVRALRKLFPDYDLYERSDADVRKKEGLPLRSGVLAGKEPANLLPVTENGLSFWVDVRQGHKTGFYLDQRDNRQIVRELSAGKTVLNAFSYSGGFGVYALAGGAERVTNVDVSRQALELAEKNLARNVLDASRSEQINGDVFRLLRDFREQNRRFDVIVLDPPKFIFSTKDLLKGSRGYQDINRMAFHLLNPGGTLVTFSCSGLMKRDLFQKIVADAALEANRTGRIVRALQQAGDHPVALTFPEGFYLKGLQVHVD